MGHPRSNVVVVVPAYTAAKTLTMTCTALPYDIVDLVISGLNLSEHHTGYRTFHRHVLAEVNLERNSDHFDPESIAQIVVQGLRIGEVAVPTRYFKEASPARFRASVVDGLSTLKLLTSYTFHMSGMFRQKQFNSLAARYSDGRTEPPSLAWVAATV